MSTVGKYNIYLCGKGNVHLDKFKIRNLNLRNLKILKTVESSDSLFMTLIFHFFIHINGLDFNVRIITYENMTVRGYKL